ncbi:unnamed protein product [Symbiodinium natans]|uniref:Uncharacterized protein n=1 Tax=Symbiodinium natans TaxID=878477 RepID=A0A812Q6C4_9DINO|nr:unnamed protein product [Symbiodinium natans]
MIRYVPFQPSAAPPPVVAFLATPAEASEEPHRPEPRLLARSVASEEQRPRPRPSEVQTEDSPPVQPTEVQSDQAEQVSSPSVQKPRLLGFSEFWQPAVRQFCDLYLRRRWAPILRALLHLQVGHWRQLLDFGAGFRTFVFDPNSIDPVPRVLPWEVLQYVWLVVFMACSLPSPPSDAESMPLLYLQLALFLRALCRPTHPTGKPAAGPPPVVQFLVLVLGCPATASLLRATAEAYASGPAALQSAGGWEAWTVAFETAWRSEGWHVLRSCKAVLGELYPGEGRGGTSGAPTLSLQPH